MTWHDRLKLLIAQWEKREGRTLTNPGLAEISGVPEARIAKYRQGKVAQPRGEILRDLAESLGSTLEYLRDNRAPQVVRREGDIGAGELLYVLDENDPDETIQFTLGLTDPVAFRVRGQSMAPAYRNGDVIVCERMRVTVPDLFLNKDCVVKLTSGAGYLKRVTKGTKPKRFNLMSYAFDPMENQELEWAAPVQWIKRA